MIEPASVRQHKRFFRMCRTPVLAALILFQALPALFAAGCRPRSTARNGEMTGACPAPAVVPSGTGEDEYWRRQYQANRPAAPERYQVFPKPPRNNSFAEFDDSLQQGLDRQPALPPLPADAYPPPPSRPLPGGRQPEFFERPAVPPTPPGFGAAAVSVARPDHASASPSGVVAGSHFYPVEQLVFGGDYPDIDKAELYRLMPKDVITVTVRDHPEFSGQMEIQPDGTVRIPNSPDIVRIRGLTVEEAAEELRRVLAVYVKGECRVRVQANRARGGYYFVFGEVLQPGRFPMGMEPLPLSQAVLAANWEANPARRDIDGDELGPSFPAASPRGRFIAPPLADLAGVHLITPHRSQPVRARHDVRSALLGLTSEDPLVRPGQIIVVPSLDPARNRQLGLEPVTGPAAAATPAPPIRGPGLGFSRAESSTHLPEIGHAAADAPVVRETPVPAVDGNMTAAYDTNLNTGPARFVEGRPVGR